MDWNPAATRVVFIHLTQSKPRAAPGRRILRKIRAPDISIGKSVPIPLIEPGDAEDISCDLLLHGKL